MVSYAVNNPQSGAEVLLSGNPVKESGEGLRGIWLNGMA